MNIQLRCVYTVTRTCNVRSEEDLQKKLDFFKGAVTDEPGEYLYAGTMSPETISVVAQVPLKGKLLKLNVSEQSWKFSSRPLSKGCVLF